MKVERPIIDIPNSRAVNNPKEAANIRNLALTETSLTRGDKAM